jgi:hypothetical protein
VRPSGGEKKIEGVGEELVRIGDIVVFGQSRVNPQDQRQIAMQLSYYSVSGSVYTEFRAEYVVSGGWQIKVEPANGNQVGPVGQRPVCQVVYLLNLNNAPFQMQVKVGYRYGSQPLSDVGVVRWVPVS